MSLPQYSPADVAALAPLFEEIGAISPFAPGEAWAGWKEWSPEKLDEHIDAAHAFLDAPAHAY